MLSVRHNLLKSMYHISLYKSPRGDISLKGEEGCCYSTIANEKQLKCPMAMGDE